MEFMSCGSCSGLCQVNGTGICLGCQRGFVNLPQEDSWVRSPEREKLKLEERKKEIEEEIVTNIEKKKKADLPVPRAKRQTKRQPSQKSA